MKIEYDTLINAIEAINNMESNHKYTIWKNNKHRYQISIDVSMGVKDESTIWKVENLEEYLKNEKQSQRKLKLEKLKWI